VQTRHQNNKRFTVHPAPTQGLKRLLLHSRQGMNSGNGFTLIELLIVMVLIGLITGMAMLSMGTADPRDQQKLEAERLVKLLELATEEAIARGHVIGLELFSQGYRFAVVKNNTWIEEASDMVFMPRSLMPQMQLVLVIDENAATLSREPIQAIAPHPQITLTPDGDMELFQIKMTVTNGDSIFVVSNTQEDGLVISTENKL
jgi:general secretion pathway protein H